jgi:hypothetical protein
MAYHVLNRLLLLGAFHSSRHYHHDKRPGLIQRKKALL